MNELEQQLYDILVNRCVILFRRYYPGDKHFRFSGEQYADIVDDLYDEVSDEVANDQVLAMNLASDLDEVSEAVWMLEDNVKYEVGKRIRKRWGAN